MRNTGPAIGLTPGEWHKTLEDFCAQHFGVPPATFLDALQMSPNARGYILGSLSELFLWQHLEGLGYQVKRIKEKWVGPKLHHGDLYVSKNGHDWFVVESKGLKSNAERWHKIGAVPLSRKGLEAWFRRKRRGEIKEWWDRLPDERRERILESGRFNQARFLETHFVSGTAGRAGRKIATPRKSEFHAVGLDLYLRTGQHEFVYAAAHALASPSGHPEHCKQNYLIDIMIPDIDEAPTLPPPWTTDFNEVFVTLSKPISEVDMQVDLRKPGEREAE